MKSWRRTSTALAMLGASAAALAQNGVAIRDVQLERLDGGALLTVAMSLELNKSLRSALESGVEIGFIAELKIIERGWVLEHDLEHLAYTTRLRRRSFGQGYEYLAFNSQTWLQAATSAEALAQMGRLVLRFEDTERLAALANPKVYLSHRIEVDLDLLASPLQVDLLTSNDWLFSSGWQPSQQ